MAKQTNFYYVLMLTTAGAVFVTSVDYRDKSAYWNKNETPLELSKERARDLTLGLNLNGYTAVTVCNPFKLDTQPYRYDLGGFEWVANKDKKNK